MEGEGSYFKKVIATGKEITDMYREKRNFSF
jgi:hypothetical protein